MSTENTPVHIGFIVDGNRRWARENNLPTLEGHKKGFSEIETIAEKVFNSGVKFASFYVFSTENWQRSKEEVSYLMQLLRAGIGRLSKKMFKNNIKCLVLGGEKNVPEDLLKSIKEAEELTKDCTGGTACFCFNYGGQQEIVDAANKAAKDGEITIESLSQNLYKPEVPPVDLIVRTSGEERISGFMLWRAAYSEFIFLKKYWPDITPDDIDEILKEYKNRQRRFGK
ncbi:di-trans,poly-cis-decaprenylcistransferase [Candidatus Saccharibacteria bacterium]|nr:di-trans,poly-cis-decaprenylcistransferase [Candidatus Saccharibacteria bacterium]